MTFILVLLSKYLTKIIYCFNNHGKLMLIFSKEFIKGALGIRLEKKSLI